MGVKVAQGGRRRVMSDVKRLVIVAVDPAQDVGPGLRSGRSGIRLERVALIRTPSLCERMPHVSACRKARYRNPFQRHRLQTA